MIIIIILIIIILIMIISFKETIYIKTIIQTIIQIDKQNILSLHVYPWSLKKKL